MPLFRLSAPQFFRWALLALIPVAWCGLVQWGALDFLESKFLDWRFRLRGEMAAPVKIVYVDIDSRSLSEIGNLPWDRTFYAEVSSALLSAGEARVIGIDLVLSRTGVAESIDRRKHVNGNLALRKFLLPNPPVVLAAAYAGREFRDIQGNLAVRALPVVTGDAGDLARAEPPETPEFEVNYDPAHPIFWSPANVGLIDTFRNGTRIVPAYVPGSQRSRGYLHLALELARLYWKLPPEAVQIGRDEITFTAPGGRRVATIPLREHQWLEVNWFSSWDSERRAHLEFSTVLGYARALRSPDAAERATAARFFSQGEFRDAVVLIGPVDPLVQDLATTPLDPLPVPRVGLHGNLLQTIMSGRYLSRLPVWNGWAVPEYLIIFVLAFAVTGFAVRGGGQAVPAKVVAAGVVGAYCLVAGWAFAAHHWILPMAGPLGAAFSMTLVAVAWQLVDEEKQKGRIKNLFGTYVSPQLVNRMIESRSDPRLGGHELEITAYFSDIQAFSTFSEQLESGPLVELLNEYLTACTEIIHAEGGTLDKYIGDAVVAMFGAPVPFPDHAARACRAAQRVQEQLHVLREKWRQEGAKWPEIVGRMRTRIGLNSGRVTVGNMGSRTRFNYTMMGDNVNLAARMESGAKAYGVYTMVTEATVRDCAAHAGEELVFRALDRIVVKGRTKPVHVYELVGRRGAVDPRTLECLRWFDAALGHYLAREWPEAIAKFERAAELEPFGQEGADEGGRNPSLVFLARCRALAAEPPPGEWNGVYLMKTK